MVNLQFLVSHSINTQLFSYICKSKKTYVWRSFIDQRLAKEISGTAYVWMKLSQRAANTGLLVIACLMSRDDKRRNKNVALAMPRSLSFRGIVTELSAHYRFSSTLRHAAKAWITTIYSFALSSFSLFLPLASPHVMLHPADLHSTHNSMNGFTFSINLPPSC